MFIKYCQIQFSLFLFLGFFLLEFLCVSDSFSQGLKNHGAVITINASASSSSPYVIIDGGVNGIFTNESDGAYEGKIDVLNTGGTLIVPGDWKNTANNNVFNGDGSTVILNGSNVQRIGPIAASSGKMTSFTNLTLGGTNIKTLDINTQVGGNAGTGILDLADRLLELNQNTLTVSNPSSGTSATSAIRFTTGGIYSEYENSIISWKTQLNTGNHIYPFVNSLSGSGTSIPFELNITAAGSESVAGTGTVGLSTFFSSGNASTPASVTNMLPAETSAADRFWSATVAGYTSGSEPTSDMYFHYDDSPTELGGIPEADLLAQEWTTNWQLPVGTLNTASNYVVVASKKPKTHPWVLGYGPSPLPVSLLSLNADCEGNHVKITWTTASENNSKTFTVERLAGTNTFVSVDSVSGAGNSNHLKNYSVNDNNCKDKSCYYRLKQTDIDGKANYSNVVAVACQNNKDFEILSLHTQAGARDISMVVNADEEESFNYILYNSLGQQINSGNSSVTKGNNIISLDITAISQGAYFLLVKSEKRTIIKKLPVYY